MRAGKELAFEDNDLMRSILGTTKKKSKKEELIDRKIENLLETYKRQDEELIRKAKDKEYGKQNKSKGLRDKFGFSDDDDDDDLDLGEHSKSKKVYSGAL